MKVTLFVVGLALSATVVQAQGFSSGSTGADGALSLGLAETRVVQVPDSGIFNFTTVNIPNSASLLFTPNQRNTPVTILAQGAVTIAGLIELSGNTDRTPGPGGFFGGAIGASGFGPGGGQTPGASGQWVGPLSLVPIIGGSGGAGWTCCYNGGGGGGAIVIASSTSITCSGRINANGGGQNSPGGNGAGGAIRLVANTLNVSGRFEAFGFGNNDGLIRMEAQLGQLNYTGSSTPSAVLSPINPTIIPTPTTAGLTISSIGGFPVFSDTGVRPGTVDVVLPRGLADPIAVAVQARNIPLGTQVTLNLSGSSGVTYTPGTLAGSFDLSNATLQVSGLDRNAETHLFVFATFDVPQTAARLNSSGPDQVARVRVQAAPGQPSTMAFLRRDGSVIDPKKIPAALLKYFSYQGH